MSRSEFFPSTELTLFERDTKESHQQQAAKLDQWLALDAVELRSLFGNNQGLSKLLFSRALSHQINIHYTLRTLLVLNKEVGGDENPFGISLINFLGSEDDLVFEQGCQLLQALIGALPAKFLEEKVVPPLMRKLNGVFFDYHPPP